MNISFKHYILFFTLIGEVSFADFCSLSFVGYSPNLVEQNTEFTCGPACLLSWLKSVGEFSYTEEGLSSTLKTDPSFGTHYRDFVNGLSEIGLKSEFRDDLRLSHLSKLLSLSYGIILSIQSYGEGHWALLAGISTDGKFVKLMDPWEAKTSNSYTILPIEELQKSWYDYFGNNYELKIRSAILIDPIRLIPVL